MSANAVSANKGSEVKPSEQNTLVNISLFKKDSFSLPFSKNNLVTKDPTQATNLAGRVKIDEFPNEVAELVNSKPEKPKTFTEEEQKGRQNELVGKLRKSNGEIKNKKLTAIRELNQGLKIEDDFEKEIISFEIDFDKVRELEIKESKTPEEQTKKEQEIQKLENKYQLLSIQGIFLGIVAKDDPELLKIKMKNRIINIKLNLLRAQFYVNYHLDLILTALKIDKKVLENTSSIIYEISTGEAHNGGRSPVKVLLKDKENQTLFVFYFKFRRAHADQDALQLLQYFNQTNKTKWHIYDIATILKPTPGWVFLSETEELSVWDFVKGESLNFKNENKYVEWKSKEDNPALMQILRHAHIGDVHNNYENCIKLAGTNLLVPIDLEGRIFGKDAIAEEDKSPKDLIGSCLEVLKTFTAMKQKTPARVFPKMSTKGLSVRCGQVLDGTIKIDKFAKDLLEDFEAIYGEGKIKYQFLATLLMWDILNGDVPYFTNSEDRLYYGLKSTNLLLT